VAGVRAGLQCPGPRLFEMLRRLGRDCRARTYANRVAYVRHFNPEEAA